MRDSIIALVNQVVDLLKGTGGADIFSVISDLLSQIFALANTAE